MYDEFDDEVFLAPETTVSLHFDTEAGDGSQGWDVAAGEALEQAERSAWARDALRATGARDYNEGDEDRSRDLRDAIRHVLTLTWD
jgi:hypothetical protein